MLRKITVSFLACLCFFINAQAQLCGFDKTYRDAIANDPVFAQKVQQMNAQIAQRAQMKSNMKIINTINGPVYEIPVVVHVIHTGGAVGTNYNPSDQQLIDMVDYLNKTYEANWPGYPNTTTGGTFIPLQFVLAKRTPQCTPTTGIVRVDGSSLPGYTTDGMAHNGSAGAPEAAIKALSIWPNTEYYNIWVVSAIDGEDGFNSTSSFVSGFAWFPGANPALDGTVMLAYSANQGETTLPHEVGHAFSLYHTFDGDNPTNSGPPYTCPVNANPLTDGDMVADTDPHIRDNYPTFHCPAATATNSCTGQPYGFLGHNIMDYSTCPDRFTPGQRDRITDALVASSRASLISSLGGQPLPASAMPAACIPAGISSTGSNSGVWDVHISDATLTYMSLSSQGYSGDGSLFYIDNTCKHQVELIAGNTYDFSITTGPSTENVKAYVDYNNDGIFAAAEEIFSNTGSSAFETHNFQYAVPTTATVPGLVSCVPLRMRIISDIAATSTITPCGQLSSGQAEDYSIIIRGGGPTTGSVAVTLTSGTNPSCFNSPLTFTAVPGAGLTATGYSWYVNNASVGVTTNTFTTSTVTDNDLVSVKMYFQGPCGSDSSMSNNFLVQRAATVPAGVSIAVTSGTNPGCPGQTLTLTAIPANGGTSPAYTWRVNGSVVGTGATYSGTFNNNDAVTVHIVSNSSCAVPDTATSAPEIIQHLFDVQNVVLGLTGGTNPSCAGTALTFTAAVINGGASPQIQWLVNGSAVPGATGITFTTSTLSNNDTVTATSIASGPCILNPNDTSDPFIVTIHPLDTPNIQIAVTEGSNPGCLDSLIEFTATVTKHGTAPDLVWLVNGIPIDTGYIFSSSTLFNGDIIELRSAATDTACYSSDTVLSAPIVMVRGTTPASPVISFIGNMLVSNVGGNLQWYGPNGLIPNATGATYHPTAPGTYYAVVVSNGCGSAPSNKLTVSLLDIATYDMSQVSVYPNPTKGQLTLDWGTESVNVRIDVYSVTGQGLMHEELKNGTRKVLNLAHFANGNYFVVVRDETGKTGTVRITLNK